MAGYYRQFYKNSCVIVEHLTNLQHKDKKLEWQEKCQMASEKVKAMLIHKSILCALNFQKPFKLAVNASDVGTGAVLLQEDVNGV